MNRVFVLLCCFFALQAQAEPNVCMSGEWHYDADKSDNVERLLKKIMQKQKQKDQQMHYVNSSFDTEKEDLTLSDKIPIFVFRPDDLLIAVEKNSVIINMQNDVRQLSIDQAVSLSLANLDKHNEQVLAAWDKNALLVETTFPNGSHIIEQFQLKELSRLIVNITIRHPFEKKNTQVHKEYSRQSLLSTQCR